MRPLRLQATLLGVALLVQGSCATKPEHTASLVTLGNNEILVEQVGGPVVFEGRKAKILPCVVPGNSAPATVTVEPGGMPGLAITSADDTLRVPVGAVTQKTTFTLQRQRQQGRLMVYVESDPETASFAQPLVLVLASARCTTPPDLSNAIVARLVDGAPGTLVQGAVIRSDGSARLETTHLSGYALAVPQ